MSTSQLLLLSLGAIIGSGWLFSALDADVTAGPASVISWIVGGILVLFIALTYAEVATMLPRSGAMARYPNLSHGGFTGFILAWTYLLAAGSVPAIEAIATVQYLAPHVPASWNLLQKPVTTTSLIHFPEGWLFTIVLLLVFFAINIVGARFLGRVNNGVMIWKLTIPILTFIFLFVLSFHGSNFSAYHGGFTPFGAKEIFVVIPGAGIVFSFLGFRQGLDFGGEAKNPQRSIPIATVASVLIGIVIYALLQLAFTGAIPWHAFGISPGAWTKLGNVKDATTSPFYAVLKSSGVGFLGGFASLLLIDAVVSPAGTGYIYLGTAGRTVYGMGVSDYLPRPAKAINSRKVPWLALIAGLVVAIAFSAPSKSWYGLVGFITLVTVFTYTMGGIGLAVFRRTAPDLPRPFRLKAAAFWAPVGYLAAIAIIFWSGYPTLIQALGAIFIALPLYSCFYAPVRGYLNRWVGYALGAVFLVAWILLMHWGHWILSPADPTKVHQHASFIVWYVLCAVAVYGFAALCWAFGTPRGKHLVNRAWWLLTLMFGETFLSYYSSFGVQAKQSHLLQFPYDTIWALLIGLAIYFWAVQSGYETDEMTDILAAAANGIAPSDNPLPAGPGV
ncbi:MAG: APC family permease [Acidimicrobiales bacterium]